MTSKRSLRLSAKITLLLLARRAGAEILATDAVVMTAIVKV